MRKGAVHDRETSSSCDFREEISAEDKMCRFHKEITEKKAGNLQMVDKFDPEGQVDWGTRTSMGGIFRHQ